MWDSRRVRIWTYKVWSKSAKALNRELRTRRLRHVGAEWKPWLRDKRTRLVLPGYVINWGSTESIPVMHSHSVRLLNIPVRVAKVVDKLAFYGLMHGNGVRVPPFTTDKEVVKQWFAEKPKQTIVFARTVLNGHSGQGIHILTSESVVRDAAVYTKYVPKKDEYRVHVAFGKVIAVQRKALRNDIADRNPERFRIQNAASGFVFVRGNVNLPIDVLTQALKAMEVSGLDFGALDVIFNEKQDQAYVLEINTAPGLEGSTINDYATAFRAYCS